jgi:hypothetical protein
MVEVNVVRFHAGRCRSRLREHVREHVRLCTLYAVATRRGPAVLVERILRLLRGPASKGSYRARNQKPETAVTVGTSVTRRRASRIFVFRDSRPPPAPHEITFGLRSSTSTVYHIRGSAGIVSFLIFSSNSVGYRSRALITPRAAPPAAVCSSPSVQSFSLAPASSLHCRVPCVDCALQPLSSNVIPSSLRPSLLYLR